MRTETLDFKAFMSRERTKNTENSLNTLPLLAFIPLNPTAMIDPVFIAIAGGILLVALVEKKIAESGHIPIAAFISAFLRISFPIVGTIAFWLIINR
jgi:hypothetical protein